MESLKQSLKNLLGETYHEALITYKDSNASKPGHKRFSLATPQAAYNIVEAVKTFISSENEEFESHQKNLIELSQVIYGLYVLYSNTDKTTEQAKLLLKGLELICKEQDSFILDEGNDFTVFSAVRDFCTLFMRNIA